MRIGLINSLHGRQSTAPSWYELKERAALAEAVGFDLFVFEDALLYRGGDH